MGKSEERQMGRNDEIGTRFVESNVIPMLRGIPENGTANALCNHDGAEAGRTPTGYEEKADFVGTPMEQSLIGRGPEGVVETSVKNNIYSITPPPGAYIIGFDTEYYYEPVGGARILLSYQWSGISPEGATWSGFVLAKNGKQLSLSQFIALAFSQGREMGIFNEYPKKIYFTAHWTLTDLTAFSDFRRFKNGLDGLRKSLVTTMNPLLYTWTDRNRNRRKLSIIVLDTMFLTPKVGKLALLGHYHNLPKIELPAGAIKRMDHLLRDAPELFRAYAIRDAEISALHVSYWMNLSHKLTGSKKYPVTLSGLGLKYLLQYWKDNDYDIDQIIGTTQERVRNDEKKYNYALKPTTARYEYEDLARRCYLGGRNECYTFGPTAEGSWLDWDLCSAYTTAMSMLKIPNYGAARPSVDPADFLPEQLGLASIDFSFPPDTRFPCLPIATPRGLIFPLKGRTCACSPEIFLARQLGADITIRQGVIVPWLNDRKPFAEVISAIQNKRNSLPRDSLEYAMWKEMGNSIYGKLAQGIHRKPVFDTRSETHKTMPPSKISNPYLAAWITSMLRAVLCEILSGIPANRTVVSATTDGFICDAPEEEIIQATQGHLCRLLSRARNNLIGNPDILEVKHGASMLLAWRTRGQATVRGLSNKRIILARGGFQTKGLKEQEANDWLVNIFVERDTTLTNEVETIGSLHRIYLKGEDFKPEYLVRKVRMDYDWKRALVSHSVRPLSGIDLVSFSTRPWETVEDHMNCISLWETFRDRGGRVLKVEKDLTDFLEYKAARIRAQDAPHLVPRERPALTIALRQFLRAYVRDSWGL